MIWVVIIGWVVGMACALLAVFGDRAFHPMSDEERKIP